MVVSQPYDLLYLNGVRMDEQYIYGDSQGSPPFKSTIELRHNPFFHLLMTSIFP